MKKILFVISLVFSLVSAKTLVVDHGIVKAHTEVFGDSTIDPFTKAIISHLSMDNKIESIKGSMDVLVWKLESDNHKRDEHMAKAIESKLYPVAHYTFKQITPSDNGYTIKGILNFHGVANPLSFKAQIVKYNKNIEIKAKSFIKLSDYKVKPIKLLFLTVRDRVDLNVDVVLKDK